MSGTILIVDDEEELAQTLAWNFQQAGFRTAVAFNGEEALRLAKGDPTPNLVLLDLMLPDTSGIEVCRELRSDRRTRDLPIVILTARDDEIDRVVGFEVGADDYVTKPFSVRELILRVRAILRRLESAPGGGDVTRLGRLRLDTAGHRVWVDDVEAKLTAVEFRLLRTLWSRKGRVQTRDSLLMEVWGNRTPLTRRTVDTHVQRLRAKLGQAADCIETVRGVGYRLRPGEAAGAGPAEAPDPMGPTAVESA